MFITKAEAENMNKDSLKNFLSRKIPEGSFLDYKVAFSAGKKNKYKEFLKDVTAFANSNGGDILIGVKEPKEKLPIGEQIVGIDNGKDEAENLERVASSSIQPRVSGLKIYPIKLENDKYVLLVHIPSSLFKPHMLDYQKTHSFYIRHRESIQPMTQHEIREAVLNSASAEGRAKEYMRTKEAEAREYIASQPAFIFQAMPLISPETSLNVLDNSIIDIIRGWELKNIAESENFYYKFECNNRPYPSISGVQGKNEIGNIRYCINFNRNAYIGVYYAIDKTTQLSELLYSVKLQ